MTRLSWGEPGSRKFDAGLDRGVLYVTGQTGVAWNGLVSVSESPIGGDSKDYYLDGEKYFSVSAPEEFEATINAFTYPDEFLVCEGNVSAYSGLILTRQRKKTFGLSYRTKVGNDTDGYDCYYKIHLIYNALAEPAQVNRNSLTDTIDVSLFSWKITTTPPPVSGYKRTAHVILDSRDIDSETLMGIENILYGTEEEAPRLPLPSELLAIFSGFALIITDNGDGTWTASGPDSVVSMIDATTFQIDSPTAVMLDADSYLVSST